MKSIKLYSLYFVLSLMTSGLVSCEKNLTTNADNALDKSPGSLSSAAFQAPSIVGFNPNPVIAGDSVKVLVQLSQPAAAGGVLVTIDKVRSAGPVVDVPTTFVIPAGQTQGAVFLHTIPFKDSIFEAIYAILPNFVSNEPALLLITPRPKSDPRPPLQVLEAENAVLKNVVAKKADANSEVFFSNGAFAQYSNSKQSYALFNVKPNRAGANILELRYAWRTSTNQPTETLIVVVNGRQYPLSFPPTASDHSNNLVYINADLNAGNNKIYVGTNTGNSAGLRLDNLTVAVP